MQIQLVSNPKVSHRSPHRPVSYTELKYRCLFYKELGHIPMVSDIGRKTDLVA